MTSPASDLEHLLDGLVPEQVEAVTHVDGALLVLAGPGSGKTTVVTRRVAHLVSLGIPAWQILALTFTNKAAGEMRQRIEALLPQDLPGRRGLTVSTFHAFCARLLRRYAPAAGLSPQYTIYDTGDQREAVKRALAAAGLSSRNWTPAAVLGTISNAKNRLLDADAFASEAGDFYGRSVAKVYRDYEKILRAADALDFDDLLLVTARLLRTDEGVRRELQDRYRYLLIDEYQDTNHAQFVLAHTLAAGHGNVCVVGDPDQSIYGWRGADIRNILDFEEHYPRAKIVPLGRNFRSTGHIVAAAAGLIGHNRRRKPKRLHTDLEDGAPPQVVTCRDEHHEATVIVDEMRRHREEQGTPWGEMAVLYRINALSRVLEEVFRSARVPYVIARGTAFYERKEVKDALAYLRAAANPGDELAIRRIVNTPTRGIGRTTLEKLELHAIDRQVTLFEAMRAADRVPDLAARAATAVGRFVALVEGWRELLDPSAGLLPEDLDLAAFVERVIRQSGLEEMYRRAGTDEDLERLENLGELISAAAEFTPPVADDGDAPGPAPPPTPAGRLAGFLESIALVSDADAVDPAGGAVTLMTLHTAKGLEFDVVAVAALEEGLLPHVRAATDEAELEEERRLCFVGMTRARRHLLLTRAAIRTHRGIRERTIASQFLGELPEEAIERLDTAGTADDLAWPDEPDPWPGDGDEGVCIGATVRHPTFGRGRVEAITRRPAGSSARVAFERYGIKTLILEYAKLTVVE
ncbi:MAG: ATP-dependent helicase [Planctomycetota bacterium]|jgi:DNA helicase-2/ATP-dependent DNA helicase PcrA